MKQFTISRDSGPHTEDNIGFDFQGMRTKLNFYLRGILWLSDLMEEIEDLEGEMLTRGQPAHI